MAYSQLFNDIIEDRPMPHDKKKDKSSYPQRSTSPRNEAYSSEDQSKDMAAGAYTKTTPREKRTKKT